MATTAVRRAGRGSDSRARRTTPQEPVRRHGSCAVCGGPVTYYPRRSDDVAPRTCSVKDSERWAHDRVSDWIGEPHRARPQEGPGGGGTEIRLPVGHVSGKRKAS